MSRYTKEWAAITAAITDYAGEFATYFTDLKTAIYERLMSPEWPRKLLAYNETGVTGAKQLNVSLYDTFAYTLGGDTSLEFIDEEPNTSPPYQSQVVQVAIKWGSSSYNLTFNVEIHWEGGVEPVPDKTANTVTLYQFVRIYDVCGVYWLGFMAGTNFVVS